MAKLLVSTPTKAFVLNVFRRFSIIVLTMCSNDRGVIMAKVGKIFISVVFSAIIAAISTSTAFAKSISAYVFADDPLSASQTFGSLPGAVHLRYIASAGIGTQLSYAMPAIIFLLIVFVIIFFLVLYATKWRGEDNNSVNPSSGSSVRSDGTSTASPNQSSNIASSTSNVKNNETSYLCQYCGNQTGMGATFCNHCGNRTQAYTPGTISSQNTASVGGQSYVPADPTTNLQNPPLSPASGLTKSFSRGCLGSERSLIREVNAWLSANPRNVITACEMDTRVGLGLFVNRFILNSVTFRYDMLADEHKYGYSLKHFERFGLYRKKPQALLDKWQAQNPEAIVVYRSGGTSMRGSAGMLYPGGIGAANLTQMYILYKYKRKLTSSLNTSPKGNGQTVTQVNTAGEVEQSNSASDSTEPGSYCPYCGTKAMADHIFCKRCGKKIG